jgi:hypothetical protein
MKDYQTRTAFSASMNMTLTKRTSASKHVLHCLRNFVTEKPETMNILKHQYSETNVMQFFFQFIKN